MIFVSVLNKGFFWSLDVRFINFELKEYKDEIEKLKAEISTLLNEKLELEKTMDDLKRQCKQNEKESQVKED